MAITEFFAGIRVADHGSMLAWYERFVGKPANFFPQDGEAVWQLTEHGWIYIVTDPEHAGKAVITILVDDLDKHVAELAERGVLVGPIDATSAAVRKLALTDPEGNRITLGQPSGVATTRSNAETQGADA